MDAEIELDIREAPLRELLLSIPKGYSVARLKRRALNDYFVREPDGRSRTRNCGSFTASRFPGGR